MNDHPDSYVDPHLIDAALDGRLFATRLEPVEREFVVSHLSDKGESVGQIADRLHCSRRLVQRIRQSSRGDE